MAGWTLKALKTAAGWVLLLAGLAALILPGPGLLLVLAGLVVLSQEYPWAARRVEPVKQRAFAVTKAGVSSWWRILGSFLGAAGLIAAGVIWWINPTIPELGPIGPKLPFGGWATGFSISVSGMVAMGLLVYSVVRFREVAVKERREARAARPADERA